MCKVMSTDLNTGWFTQLDGVWSPEPVPTGLAQAYYTALSALQYEGNFEITEQECGTIGGPFLGKVLNLTGGALEAWSSMNAAIFETTEDIATGTTKLRFGPVEYLSPKDWITWLRVNRWREVGYLAARTSGLLTIGAHPVGGTHKHDRGGNASRGPAKATVTVGGNAVTVQPTTVDNAVTDLPGPQALMLREVQMCVSGSMQTVLALISAPYTPSGG
jgi:hypothetical protein